MRMRTSGVHAQMAYELLRWDINDLRYHYLVRSAYQTKREIAVDDMKDLKKQIEQFAKEQYDEENHV